MVNHAVPFVYKHRLSTVLAADQILVIDNGSIAEIGKHEELIRIEGLYKRLFDTQFKAQLQKI